jgi:hypothetical protein
MEKEKTILAPGYKSIARFLSLCWRQEPLPMKLILELPDEKQAALDAKAQKQSMTPEDYAAWILVRHLDDEPNPAAEQPVSS